MRRAQISGQVFVFVFGLMVAGAIIMLGYKLINKIPTEEANIAVLKKEIATEISAAKGYATIKNNKAFGVSRVYTEICFVDLEIMDKNPTKIDLIDKPLIKDSVESKRTMNVFLYPTGEKSLYIEDMKVADGYKCFPNAKGTVKITKMIGCGDSTLITSEVGDDETKC